MEIYISISAVLSDRALQDILIRGKQNVKVTASRKVSNTQYLFSFIDDNGENVVCRATLSQTSIVSNNFVLRKVEPLATVETLWHVQKTFDKYDRAGTSLSSPPPLYSLIYPLADFGIQRTPDLDDIVRDWQEKFKAHFNMRWASVDWRAETIEVSLQDPARQNMQLDNKMKETIGSCLNNYLKHRGK